MAGSIVCFDSTAPVASGHSIWKRARLSAVSRAIGSFTVVRGWDAHPETAAIAAIERVLSSALIMLGLRGMSECRRILGDVIIPAGIDVARGERERAIDLWCRGRLYLGARAAGRVDVIHRAAEAIQLICTPPWLTLCGFSSSSCC